MNFRENVHRQAVLLEDGDVADGHGSPAGAHHDCAAHRTFGNQAGGKVVHVVAMPLAGGAGDPDAARVKVMLMARGDGRVAAGGEAGIAVATWSGGTVRAVEVTAVTEPGSA